MQPFRAKLYWAVDYLQEVGQKCWWGRCRERSVRAEDRECLHFGNANGFTQTNCLFFVRISVISRKEQKNRQTEPADLPESIRQFQTVCFSTKTQHNNLLGRGALEGSGWTILKHIDIETLSIIHIERLAASWQFYQELHFPFKKESEDALMTVWW